MKNKLTAFLPTDKFSVCRKGYDSIFICFFENNKIPGVFKE